MRISVIIPAFNEEESIVSVLKDIDKNLVNEIIVVDNASTDNTVKIAKQNGAIVVRENRMGYGWACLAAMEIVNKPDVIVFLDGDYSDYPNEIVNLIKPIKDNKVDFVIGTRTKGNLEKGALSPPQRFGNWLACTLLNLLFKTNFTDLGPFRAIKWDTLKQMDMQDKRFGWTIEMQIKSAFMNIATIEIPVSYRQRIFGKSKVSGTIKGVVLAGSYILYYIVAAFIKKIYCHSHFVSCPE